MSIGEADQKAITQSNGVINTTRAVPAEVAFKKHHSARDSLQIIKFHAAEGFIVGIGTDM